MPELGFWKIVIIAVVILVLFGSKKLPDAARGIGRSLRIFKAETKGLMSDDDELQPQPQPGQPQAQAQQLPSGPVSTTQLQEQAEQLRQQALRLEEAAQSAQPAQPAPGGVNGAPAQTEPRHPTS